MYFAGGAVSLYFLIEKYIHFHIIDYSLTNILIFLQVHRLCYIISFNFLQCPFYLMLHIIKLHKIINKNILIYLVLYSYMWKRFQKYLISLKGKHDFRFLEGKKSNLDNCFYYVCVVRQRVFFAMQLICTYEDKIQSKYSTYQ